MTGGAARLRTQHKLQRRNRARHNEQPRQDQTASEAASHQTEEARSSSERSIALESLVVWACHHDGAEHAIEGRAARGGLAQLAQRRRRRRIEVQQVRSDLARLDEEACSDCAHCLRRTWERH
jgi:hypothetical protein